MWTEWEYRDEIYKSSYGWDCQTELDKLGGMGWECYAVTNDRTKPEYKKYHFKRKKFGDNQ